MVRLARGRLARTFLAAALLVVTTSAVTVTAAAPAHAEPHASRDHCLNDVTPAVGLWREVGAPYGGASRLLGNIGVHLFTFTTDGVVLAGAWLQPGERLIVDVSDTTYVPSGGHAFATTDEMDAVTPGDFTWSRCRDDRGLASGARWSPRLIGGQRAVRVCATRGSATDCLPWYVDSDRPDQLIPIGAHDKEVMPTLPPTAGIGTITGPVAQVYGDGSGWHSPSLGISMDDQERHRAPDLRGERELADRQHRPAGQIRGGGQHGRAVAAGDRREVR